MSKSADIISRYEKSKTKTYGEIRKRSIVPSVNKTNSSFISNNNSFLSQCSSSIVNIKTVDKIFQPNFKDKREKNILSKKVIRNILKLSSFLNLNVKDVNANLLVAANSQEDNIMNNQNYINNLCVTSIYNSLEKNLKDEFYLKQSKRMGTILKKAVLHSNVVEKNEGVRKPKKIMCTIEMKGEKRIQQRSPQPRNDESSKKIIKFTRNSPKYRTQMSPKNVNKTNGSRINTFYINQGVTRSPQRNDSPFAPSRGINISVKVNKNSPKRNINSPKRVINSPKYQAISPKGPSNSPKRYQNSPKQIVNTDINENRPKYKKNTPNESVNGSNYQKLSKEKKQEKIKLLKMKLESMNNNRKNYFNHENLSQGPEEI